MKANELMIGDWVEFHQSDGQAFYAQVEALTDDGTFSESGFYNDSDVSPIPITAEILEKNGFNMDDCIVYFKEDEHYMLEMVFEDGKLKWTINCSEYTIMEFKYVHELQHALRLCGIGKEIELCTIGNN